MVRIAAAVTTALALLSTSARAASADDLRRAVEKKPRQDYKGDGSVGLSRVLNGHLKRSERGLAKACSEWSHQELQGFMATLLSHRNPELDRIYRNTTDRRRLHKNSLGEYKEHWSEVNAEVQKADHLQKPLRDSHCRQAVMWWTHHLDEITRKELRQQSLVVPLLPEDPKPPCEHYGFIGQKKVCTGVEQENSCDWCHSLQSESEQEGKYAPNALEPQFVGPDDGNPHKWDRKRRCDQDYKDPPCGICEGIGGVAWSDKNEDIKITTCTPLKTPDQVDMKTVTSPIYPKKFTNTGYKDVIIGRKHDPFCFAFFPENNSSGTECYRAEDATVKYYDIEKESVRTDYNIKMTGAFGLFTNITSTVQHVGKYMWIINHLWLGFDQCVCTDPGRTHCTSAPNCSSYAWHYDFAKDAQYLGRERIGVEWLGEMELDHFILWSHHMWTDPVSKRLVRLWKPWNGLQIYSPDAWTDTVADASVFDSPPALCKKGGAKVRIHCDDDGNYEDGKHEGLEFLKHVKEATGSSIVI